MAISVPDPISREKKLSQISDLSLIIFEFTNIRKLSSLIVMKMQYVQINPAIFSMHWLKKNQNPIPSA